MRRIAALTAAFTLSLSLWAQSSLETLKYKLLNTRVTMDYSYVIDGKVPVKGSGALLLQGRCYHLNGNGLDIYCDGDTRWTVDVSSKEVYIENAADTESEFFFTNPEKLLANVTGLKTTADSAGGTYVDPAKGTSIKFSLTGIKSSAIADTPEAFTYNSSTLDPTWTVTDLR